MRDGEPIQNRNLPDTIDTGISYTSLYPGLVPEIEEREAARANGYTWKQWLDLPRRERVSGIAYCRMSRVIDFHRQDAVNRDAKSRELRRRAASHGS